MGPKKNTRQRGMCSGRGQAQHGDPDSIFDAGFDILEGMGRDRRLEDDVVSVEDYEACYVA